MKKIFTTGLSLLGIFSLVQGFDMACSFEYNPVCGEDGKTYINNCLITLNKIKIKHSGVCDDYKKCEPSYDFFCGKDGKTYLKNCRSGYMPIPTKHQGECNKINKKDNDSCSGFFDPICGEDGKTYSNCFLDSLITSQIAHDGPCKENNITPDSTATHNNTPNHTNKKVTTKHNGSHNEISNGRFSRLRKHITGLFS